MKVKRIKNHWDLFGPIHIDEHNWFYFDRKTTIDLIHETTDQNGRVIKAEMIAIPRRTLAKAMGKRSA
jgi:hypothetical protein